MAHFIFLARSDKANEQAEVYQTQISISSRPLHSESGTKSVLQIFAEADTDPILAFAIDVNNRFFPWLHGPSYLRPEDTV